MCYHELSSITPYCWPIVKLSTLCYQLELGTQHFFRIPLRAFPRKHLNPHIFLPRSTSCLMTIYRHSCSWAGGGSPVLVPRCSWHLMPFEKIVWLYIVTLTRSVPSPFLLMFFSSCASVVCTFSKIKRKMFQGEVGIHCKTARPISSPQAVQKTIFWFIFTMLYEALAF